MMSQFYIGSLQLTAQFNTYRNRIMLDRTAKLKTYQTYIDGRWIDAASGKTFETFDPYTGQPWALIPECDKVDVDQAVDAASRAFERGCGRR